MRTRDTDLIVTMVDFERPGVGTHQYMSQSSFEENVINNDYFQKALEAGLIKCLLTHQGRDYADNDKTGTPYDDLLATHPDLCGVVRDVWLDGSKAMASIDLFDGQAFPAAAKLKDLIKKGTFVGVSMATECEINPQGNYDIKALLGCDFTLDNFFMGSGIVTIKKNFSRLSGVQKINFSNKDLSDQEVIFMAQNFAVELDDAEYWGLLEEHGEEFLQERDSNSAPIDMEDFDTVLSEEEPHDLALKMFNGKRYNPNPNGAQDPFNPNDDYFAFDGSNNLISIIDDEDLVDYIADQIMKDEFSDWCVVKGYLVEREEGEEQ